MRRPLGKCAKLKDLLRIAEIAVKLLKISYIVELGICILAVVNALYLIHCNIVSKVECDIVVCKLVELLVEIPCCLLKISR